GLIRALRGEWPQALEDCDRALLLQPEHPAAYYLRGQARQRLGRHREALEDFRAAARREPAQAPSLTELQRALDLDPRDALAHNHVAWGYVTAPEDRRVLGLALLCADRALLLAPGNWYCQNTLGAVYYRLGRWRQAREALEHSLRVANGQGTAF